MRPSVLIVEDAPALAKLFALQLETGGFNSIIIDNGEEAYRTLRSMQAQISAIVLDLNLPDTDGLTLLKARPEIVKQWPVIAITADGSIDRAIGAMRLGAFDFLVKPIAQKRLIAAVQSAICAHQQTPITVPCKTRDGVENGYGGFVGTSPSMQKIYQQIEQVAPSKATIFISGESGTGKEVCAEAIHKASPRKERPFVPVNCGAIPENLLESQIFGHVKGAFTGATSHQDGAAQAADCGTLFLDEICELDLALQVKLLRFIQTGSVQRLGSSRIEAVDVRIICATNRDVEEEVRAKRFREDLYYRLAVIPISLPPLRHRGEDIVLLARSFMHIFCAEEGKDFAGLSPELERALRTHNWPGNVRELQNFIRRAAVIHGGANIPASFTPTRQTAMPGQPELVRMCSENPLEPQADYVDLPAYLKGKTLDEIERTVINLAITVANGSLPVAARNLGISPSTLYRKKERWEGKLHGGF